MTGGSTFIPIFAGHRDGCKTIEESVACARIPRGERLHATASARRTSGRTCRTTVVVNIRNWLQRSKPNWMRKTISPQAFPRRRLNIQPDLFRTIAE